MRKFSKYRLVIDLVRCMNEAKKTLGDQFETTMAECAIEVVNCQYKAGKEEPISFAAAGLLLCMFNDEPLLPSEKEDNRLLTVYIKACIAWRYIESYDRQYGL